MSDPKLRNDAFVALAAIALTEGARHPRILGERFREARAARSAR